MPEEMFSRRLKLQSPPDFEVYSYEIPPQKIVNQTMNLIEDATNAVERTVRSPVRPRGVDISLLSLNAVLDEHGLPCITAVKTPSGVISEVRKFAEQSH